jgi:hypothetical protein
MDWTKPVQRARAMGLAWRVGIDVREQAVDVDIMIETSMAHTFRTSLPRLYKVLMVPLFQFYVLRIQCTSLRVFYGLISQP